MRICLCCDDPISDTDEAGLFRIRLGGIDYERGTRFIPATDEHFGDHTTTKWMCCSCAVEHELFIEELGTDTCLAPSCKKTNATGRETGTTFEPVTSFVAESVLLLEWGRMRPSKKAGGLAFASGYKAHVHYNCACDDFNLPLHAIPLQDEPG